MPKDTTWKGPLLKALVGASSIQTTASPTSVGMAMVMCDTCFLNLPRNLGHQDVITHSCYRGFTIALSAAGALSLS